jgi:hypothetical protein
VAVDRELLVGGWVHAHEEDTPGRQVFRPAGTSLPPSRGRRSLELREDGTLVEGGPGPTDVPAEVAGTWNLSGNQLELRSARGESVREVVSAGRDRLVIGD